MGRGVLKIRKKTRGAKELNGNYYKDPYAIITIINWESICSDHFDSFVVLAAVHMENQGKTLIPIH
jgi:hypothetical protein